MGESELTVLGTVGSGEACHPPFQLGLPLAIRAFMFLDNVMESCRDKPDSRDRRRLGHRHDEWSTKSSPNAIYVHKHRFSMTAIITHYHRCDTAQDTSPNVCAMRLSLGDFFMFADFDLDLSTEKWQLTLRVPLLMHLCLKRPLRSHQTAAISLICLSLHCAVQMLPSRRPRGTSRSLSACCHPRLGGLPLDSPRSRCQSQESRAAQEHIKGQEQLARMFSCSPVQTSIRLSVSLQSETQRPDLLVTFVCTTPFVLYSSCQFFLAAKF